MEATLFLRNKLARHVSWNGQELTFTRYKRNEYNEIIDEVDTTFTFKGLFHDGGGYGGMLKLDFWERDGATNFTKFKPIVLCMYEDGKNIQTYDVLELGGNRYNVVEITNVKNLNIAFEISLEIDNGRE